MWAGKEFEEWVFHWKSLSRVITWDCFIVLKLDVANEPLPIPLGALTSCKPWVGGNKWCKKKTPWFDFLEQWAWWPEHLKLHQSDRTHAVGRRHREVLCRCLFFFFFFLPTLMAYGSSQARGPGGTAAIILCRSHGNAGSEPHLQLNTSACSSARSLTHWAWPGIEPASHGY